MMEWLADDHARIDLPFRHHVVTWIFDQSKRRLKGYEPYQRDGVRLYLYQDTAPTVSVVAETPVGTPYGGEPSFVGSIDDVLRAYVGRSWRASFDASSAWITPDRLLETVARPARSATNCSSIF